MTDTVNSNWNQGFRRGRIIVPGTARQLGAFGLFRPPLPQGRVPGKHAAVEHAEGGVMWIGLGELLERVISKADLTQLALTYPTWVLDVDAPEAVNEAGPLARRFVEIAAVLEQCDVTVFLVSPGPFAWGAENPLSALELVESSDELANEAVHGS